MKASSKIWLLITVFFFLVACTSAPKVTQPTSTESVEITTPTVTPKSTHIPQPTLTHTPIPTVTFAPWPTKEVLAQFGVFGGDGGWDYYAFIGRRDMPKWILYTDGQLIVQKEDNRFAWLEETTLTIPQMCSFLSQFENVGFFTLAYDNSSASVEGIPTANPIYNFDNTTEFSEGGSHYVLQINGPNSRQIFVYRSYIQYLVPEARRIFNLFDNYSPPSSLSDYQPQYLLLRIEKGLGNSEYATPAPIMQTWPANLPPLGMLTTEKVETAVSEFFTDSSFSQVLIKNEQVKPIFEAFGNKLAYQLFQSEDQVYYVAARPFLPHETLNDFSRLPGEKQFALPFNCSN